VLGSKRDPLILHWFYISPIRLYHRNTEFGLGANATCTRLFVWLNRANATSALSLHTFKFDFSTARSHILLMHSLGYWWHQGQSRKHLHGKTLHNAAAWSASRTPNSEASKLSLGGRRGVSWVKKELASLWSRTQHVTQCRLVTHIMCPFVTIVITDLKLCKVQNYWQQTPSPWYTILMYTFFQTTPICVHRERGTVNYDRC